MRVVITAATSGEWMPALLQIDPLYTSNSKRFKVSFHESGVGMMGSTFSITQLIHTEKPDLVIQAGIAGCFDKSMPLGKVITVEDDTLADMGVEEDGRWKDLFDLKLEKSSYPPFEKKKLPNHWLETYNLLKLPQVTGITINEITTREARIQQWIKKYNPCIESMEGAALHYVCRQTNTPFIQIRAISNYIGERDKSKWVIKEAIENLNNTLLKYVEKLYKLS